MNLENEDQSSRDKAPETFCKPKKQSQISYTREFLLSLSELDICNKLPTGFDQSILSEFEDASHGIQDRQRIPGSLPLQGFRRNDYGSSPPTRGDSGNYSRGIYGRWDSRSSGRSDRDSDSQSDLDSDSGRRYGNQSRRSWQSPEHDGLLGSGSFPRPSGYAAGISAPKVQANDNYQLNRSNEPYHPPRPYKAVPHSRRETNDSYNDETFGSTECTSQDREEEERRRRASFELMRKEQHKALQEKQKSNLDKRKDDFVSDINVLLEDSKDERRVLDRNNDVFDVSATLPVSNNDSGKFSFPSQTPASRPLVPPGFTSTIVERNPGAKSLSHTHPTEFAKPEIEESLLHARAIPVQNGTVDVQERRQTAHEMGLNEQHPDDGSIHAPFLVEGEKVVNSASGLEFSKKFGVDNHLYRTARLSEAHDALDNGEIIELEVKKVLGHKTVGDASQENSTSILEKLFGSASTKNTGGSSNFVEPHDRKPDDAWSPNTVQSSKFARWFLEDENKPADDLSSGRPNDLLSLIVGGEKGGSEVSDVKASQHIPPEFSYQISELTSRLMTSDIPSATTGTSDQFYSCNKQEAVPTILTCEDLEQTMLSEYSEKSPTLQPPSGVSSVSDAKTERPKASIDDRASQHLLLLLQKGTGPNDMAPSPILDTGSSRKILVSEIGNLGTALDNPREASTENIHNLGKTLTLETLFGTAFMEELQSAEAPVSVQRGSVGSARTDVLEPHGLSFPVTDDSLFPSTVDDIGSNRTNQEGNVLASNQRHTKFDKIENWLGFEDPQTEVNSSKLPNEVVSKHGGFDGAVEIQLPEEESLIAVSDPVNPRNSMLMPAGNSTKGEFLSSNTPVDIAEKLAALNAVFKDERSMLGLEGPPFACGPYDMMEPDITYHNLHGHTSSPQFHPPQMSHSRPLFHPLDSHPAPINSQMKFMPENIVRHDAPPNHQFPTKMLCPPFHHPNTTGITGFDSPAHHPMLQQRPMLGNFPPPHVLHEFSRGPPMPPHPSNQATGFVREPNAMQGFPFGHRQPNVSGLGMAPPAPDASSGSNHPEAFQRLIEMGLRANSKQIHPFAVGQTQGTYGHELDMGFRYR